MNPCALTFVTQVLAHTSQYVVGESLQALLPRLTYSDNNSTCGEGGYVLQ